MIKKMFTLKHYQSGQGMVEYAILLILTITLVLGGIELASTALASGKASDAAKAGVSELAAVNEKRLKAQENQQKYLRQLEVLLQNATTNTYGIYVGTDLTAAEVDSFQEFPTSQLFLTQAQVDALDPANGTYFENYVKFLDYFRNKAINDLVNAGFTYEDILEAYLDFFDETSALYISRFDNAADPPLLPLDTSIAYIDLNDVFKKIDGITDDNNDGIVNVADKDGNILALEVMYAINATTSIDTNNDNVGDESFNLLVAIQNLRPATQEEKIARYKALILVEELQLAMLPLDPRIALSETMPLIGNHTPGYVPANPEFDRPSCSVDGATGEPIYLTGFPDVDNDDIPDTPVLTEAGDTINAPAIYLFNPLPINAASCIGNDATRGNRSQISILMGGYGKDGDLNYFQGLPKLNQAFYGQYTRICLDNAGGYVGCRGNAVAQTLLKPPGKYCLSNVATPGVDSCPGLDQEQIETSGYYFWGYTNAAVNKHEWVYGEATAPEFRPTMQMICNNLVDDMQLINDFACDAADVDAEPIKTVRINVRYRSVFESFLTFGLMQLINPNNIPDLAYFFYDPSNLSSLAAGKVGIPIAGSELGPKAPNQNPTVKNFKDFRGCYEVNLETNQVTSCN